MKLKSRCLPVGVLAYNDVESAVRMSEKLFEKMPFLAVIPKVFPEDTVIKRTLEKIPGIKREDKNLVLKTDSEKFKTAILALEKAYNNPSKELLEPYRINSEYMNKFEELIHKSKAANACVNLLGPFTISQLLVNLDSEQILLDKTLRKLFIQAVSVKALWVIEKIKECNSSTTPLIMLEEPALSQLGDIKRKNEEITAELVTNLLAKVVEKIKSAGAIVGVQCLEKCDWKIPINAGIDIISFDAYKNPNNLCIIPDDINEFLDRGGEINWGIVPTISESVVKASTIDTVEARFRKTIEEFIASGVPRYLAYNSAYVSVQIEEHKLPLILGEKSLILANQLSKKIPVIKRNEQEN